MAAVQLRFADYALLARGDTAVQSYLGGRPDGRHGLVRVELWPGIASDEVLRDAGAWFLALRDAPVVPLVDGAAGEHEAYFVRRLPGGVSLARLSDALRRAGGSVPAEVAFSLAMQIAALLEALVATPSALHQVTPSTVGLSWEGRAWFDPPSTAASQPPGTTQAQLSVALWAPELLRARALDARTATFQVAALAYHLWTGRPLVRGDNDFQLLDRARRGDHDELELPPSLSAARGLLDACLAAAPDDRIAHPREVADRLAALAPPRDEQPALLASFLAALCPDDREREESLREEIALLSADDVATWPLVRGTPELPAEDSALRRARARAGSEGDG